MKQSAGLLLFRHTTELEFLLVHPGGPFFAKKDLGYWTIPKGEFTDEEKALEAAKREFKEETGYEIQGHFLELTPVVQKGGKKVFCWAVAFEIEPDKIVSNTFEIEWPPRSGKRKSFPEVDQADWFNYETAKVKINEKQIPLLDEVITLQS